MNDKLQNIKWPEIIPLNKEYYDSYRDIYKNHTREQLVDCIIKLQGIHNIMSQKISLLKTFPDGNIPMDIKLNANGVMEWC